MRKGVLPEQARCLVSNAIKPDIAVALLQVRLLLQLATTDQETLPIGSLQASACCCAAAEQRLCSLIQTYQTQAVNWFICTIEC